MKTLSSFAVEVLGQLFLSGPVWDGNIISKSGRNELLEVGLASHREGWTFLTGEGVTVAVEFGRGVKHWEDQRWYYKASCQ